MELGIPFFESEAWWYYAAYVRPTAASPNWQRLYNRGPMFLVPSAAEEEFIDTVEAFWGRSVFMWKWVNGGWQLWRQIS